MAEHLGYGSSYSSNPNNTTNSKKKAQSDAVLGHSTSYEGGSNTTTSNVRGAADYGYANNQASTYNNQPRSSSYNGARLFGSS